MKNSNYGGNETSRLLQEFGKFRMPVNFPMNTGISDRIKKVKSWLKDLGLNETFLPTQVLELCARNDLTFSEEDGH